MATLHHFPAGDDSLPTSDKSRSNGNSDNTREPQSSATCSVRRITPADVEIAFDVLARKPTGVLANLLRRYGGKFRRARFAKRYARSTGITGLSGAVDMSPDCLLKCEVSGRWIELGGEG